MPPLSRRSLLKFFAATPLLFSPACQSISTSASTSANAAPPPSAPPKVEKPGHLSVLQGPTSDTQTLINVFSPRLKNYDYRVTTSTGAAVAVDLYETVEGPVHFKIVKLLISDLSVGETYRLQIFDKYKESVTLVDERTFKTLDTKKSNPRFALLSCMADDARYEPVIDAIWDRLRREDADFLILHGDAVYVDAFEFVKKEEATERDLWQRYIDTFRRIPLYHWRQLKPIFATWDDHDFGTNDGDREFKSRDAAKRLFLATFGGKALKTAWQPGPVGVTSMLTAFGQRFVFMDDRTFRQPDRRQKTKEVYGHWGREQHDWLLTQLRSSDTPTWILNGNQFFSAKAGGLKEAFESDHPAHFAKLLMDLKDVKAPFVFASGDVHFSEVMRIPKDRIGFETFELTSSCMHSTNGKGWDNPLRIPGAVTQEFNFMIITATAGGTKQMKIKTAAIGLAEQAYFEQEMLVTRDSAKA